MYSSTLPSTSALDGVGGQRHAPVALPPGKVRYPLYRRLGRSQGRFGRVRKISPPTGIRSPDRAARSESLCRLRYSHTTARRMVPAYSKCDAQLIKVAPDDGLTQSETCRASNRK